MEKLNGPFKDIIPNFIKFKKSMGYNYNNTNNYYRIDKILYNNNIYDLKDTKLIYKTLILDEKKYNRKKENYYALKQLYEYMNITGYSNLYIENINFKKKKNYIPYIFTRREIKKIFDTIDKIDADLKKNIQNIYPVFFRLLYSTGLRVSEAINLKMSDYNDKNSTIIIKMSKNRITRVIPLSKTMDNVMKQYLKLHTTNNKYFFEINRDKIKYVNINNYFKKILEICNITNCGVHSLRHTFAVTSFNNMYAKKYREEEILYYMHVYMGHTNIYSTELYLHFTKEHYDKLIKKYENKYKDVIPKEGDKK